MKKDYLSKFNAGFSMVETMIGIGLLSMVAIGAMKLSETQHEATRGQKLTQELSQTMSKMKEFVSDPRACELNFIGKKVGKDEVIGELKNSRGEVVFRAGDKPVNGNYVLTEIRLGDYSSLTSRTRLILTFKKVPEGITSVITHRFVDLFTEVESGKITKCLDPVKLVANAIREKFCQDLDPLKTSDCEDNFNNLLSEVKRYYCGIGHPFLEFDATTGKCKPLDASKKCGAGFVKGYNANGDLICYTPPASCVTWGSWNPSTNLTCPPSIVTQTRTCSAGGPSTQTRKVSGTKNDPSCCTSWSSWTPAADSSCSGTNVSQTRTCSAGWTGNDSRTVPGTGSGASCCTSWGSWTPSSDAGCVGSEVAQTRTCTSGWSGSESRTVPGTGTGSSCCTSWSSWTPLASSSCDGTDVEQTRTCTSGGTGTETRTVPGTGTGKSCCTSWDDWSPDTDFTCPGTLLTQTRSCASGSSATETRSLSGTRNHKDCCTNWGLWIPETNLTCPGTTVTQQRTCSEGWSGNESRQKDGTKVDENWTPDPAATCIEENLTQTNECGETRIVKGTKECNDCTIRHPVGWSVSLGAVVNCHCAQKGATGSSTLGNGKLKTINSNNCEIYDSSKGAKEAGTGSLVYRCDNGSLTVVSKSCEAGSIE